MVKKYRRNNFKMTQIEKAYQATKYEDKVYDRWEKSGLFTPKIVKKKKPFVISMPPPNATGFLHVGHACFLTLQDTMIRFNRMKGIPSLWLPGTDHASIATQNKVEKLLAKQGTSRHELGRKQFLKRVNEYVKQSQGTIRKQIRKMGSSCDWTRERFTLDKGLSEAVRTCFVRMYRDGLIYRGHRIVNWCPRCSSTLADDEVEYKEQKAPFYYFKYGPVIIGTARPETKFGDKVVIVHPQDKRYKHLVGKEFEVEWVMGKIKAKVVADKVADMKMGTGAMTITPGHSFVDFELAQKYGFDVEQVINEDGKLTDIAGDLAGLDAREGRKKVVEILKKKGLIERIDKNYVHNLSVCYRCGTPIEPLPSRQWFVNVDKPVLKEGRTKKTLKQKSIEVVKKGKIKVIPDRFNKTYFHWMENLHDWCISRQLWFGHRIPVWYCEETRGGCGKVIVAVDKPEKCPKCKNEKLRQDPDTLDTWFSAGLWTFSTLGWPKKTADLKYFHPTSVLETGHDILFFWVARMILMSSYCMEEVPFEKVYLHGLVRDKNGVKMSKSLGNVIDPLDMIKNYGADAVRLSLVVGTTPGVDIKLSEEKIAGYRNFVNKIWNGARFVLMSVSEKDLRAKIEVKDLSRVDKWILSRANKLIREVTDDLEKFHFSDVGSRLYNFTWNEFCDWYLECCKVKPQPAVLVYILKVIVKLSHPLMPFVSEVIWKNLGEKNLLMGETWPKPEPKYNFAKDERALNVVFDVITGIRSLRAEAKVEANKQIEAVIYGHDHLGILEEKAEVIKCLAGISSLNLQEKGAKMKNALSKFVDKTEIYLPMEGLVDAEQEAKRLEKERIQILEYIHILEAKLANKKFVQNAPKAVVESEKSKLKHSKEKLKKLEAH